MDCYSIIMSSLDEMISNMAHNGHVKNEQQYKSMIDVCDQFYSLPEWLDEEGNIVLACSVESDSTTQDICIHLICDGVLLKNSEHPLYRIADKSKRIIINWCKYRTIAAVEFCFIFPGIFNKE